MKPHQDGSLIDKIRNLGIFNHMRPEQISKLSHQVRMRKYDKGQTIFLRGDTCNSLRMIVSGMVSVYLTSQDGQEVILSELGPENMIGEMELTLKQKHATNAMASTECQMLEMNISLFHEIIDVSESALFVMRTCAAKLRDTLDFAESIALHSLATRLARLLLQFCRSHGKDMEGGTLIDCAVSQTRMGQLINASRPRVNAQLQTWKGKGMIDLRNNRIFIRDRQGLLRLSRAGDGAADHV